MMEDESETKIEVPKKGEVNIESAEPENDEGRIEIPVTESPVEPAPAQPVAEKTDDGMKEISLAPPTEPQAREEPTEPPKTDEQKVESPPAAQEEPSIRQEPVQPETQGEPKAIQAPETQAEESGELVPVQEETENQAEESQTIQTETINEKPAPGQEQSITQAAQEMENSEPAPIQADESVQQRELAGESKGIESVEGAAPSPNDAEARELTGNNAFTQVQAPPSEELPDVHKRWATRDALPAGTDPAKPRELSQEDKVQEAIRLHQENNKPKGFLARIRKIIGW